MKKNKTRIIYDLNVFPGRLRYARTKLKLSRSALGRKTNMPTNYISRYEEGEHLPRIEHLVSLSEKLNKKIDWLLGFNKVPLEEE